MSRLMQRQITHFQPPPLNDSDLTVFHILVITTELSVPVIGIPVLVLTLQIILVCMVKMVLFAVLIIVFLVTLTTMIALALVAQTIIIKCIALPAFSAMIWGEWGGAPSRIPRVAEFGHRPNIDVGDLRRPL